MVSEYTSISEEAYDALEEELDSNPPEELKGNLAYLHNMAGIFYNNIIVTWAKIQNINTIQKKKQKLKELIDQKKETEASIVQEELATYHYEMVSKKEFQDFMTKVFNFQEIVNGVLGQEVQMIYVYIGKDGQPEIYRISNSGEHIKQSMASKGRGMTARYGNLSKKFLDEHGEKIENSLKDNGEEQLNLAYKETVKRGQYSRKKLNIGFLLVLWCPAKVWLKMKISSLGDVNEAYAAFYLNMVFNDFIFNQSSDIEWLLNTFLLHDRYGVTAVDNISGFLEGDVTIGNIEYAIKSKGATTLSPEQVISLAINIKESSPEELTMDYLQTIKEEKHKAGARRNFVEALDSHLDASFDDIFSALGEQYGFRSQKNGTN